MSWLTRTLLAADPALLLKETELALHHIRQSSSPFLLFGLSKHLPASDLSQLVSALQTCTRNNVGFLCDQPSTREFHVSLAAAPTSIGVVPFRSTLRGKPTIALGRELRPGLLSERDVSPTSSSRDSLSTSDQHREEAAFLQTAHDDWHQLWGSTNHVHTLPIELQNLPTQSVTDIVYASDTSPQALFSTLDHYFPKARQLGLLASSTPFVTGRPFTMIHNSDIHSDGAVGFALTGPKSPKAPPQLSLAGWKPIGPPSVVTRAQGNIILELDDGTPPTKVLVDNIDAARSGILPVQKDTEFYLGVVDQGNVSLPPEHAHMLAKVISGDPRKGGMAVDCEESFQSGMFVQFYAPSHPSAPLDPASPGILGTFGRPSELKRTFWSPSEHGFVFKSDKANAASWLCNVPRAEVSFPL